MVNSKEVQLRADKKRKGKRTRAWTAVLYPDSAVENWREVLENLLVECLVSPLHDKDLDADNKSKKPHYHIVVSYKSPCLFRKVKHEVWDEIGAVAPNWNTSKVKDFRQMARYLCHLDQPNKYQYNVADVVSIGAIDYQSLIMSAADETEVLYEIYDYIDSYNLRSVSQLIRRVREFKPEWKRIVDKKMYHINIYCKGLNFDLEHKHE